MGIFSTIFGSSSAISEIVEHVSNGLDNLVYTKQEKAEDAKLERSEARKLVIAWMASTQGQNVARRLIALCITAVWLTMYLIATFSAILNVFISNGGKLIEVSHICESLALRMNSAVMLILAFYFAAPHMSDIIKNIKK